jgi:hypothetical protein
MDLVANSNAEVHDGLMKLSVMSKFLAGDDENEVSHLQNKAQYVDE